jgi:hypothetical protein
MSYPSAAETFADADARIELAQTLFARVQRSRARQLSCT